MAPQVLEIGGEPSLLSAEDLWLFNEGTHSALYRKLGAHPLRWRGEAGTYFAVWAPSAEAVSVVGDFNGWQPGRHPLRPRASSGIWEGFVPKVGPGELYKFYIVSKYGWQGYKADPFAFFSEPPPGTASRIWSLRYRWGDRDWMKSRAERDSRFAPISIYEVHLGSWRRGPHGHFLSYREVAPLLASHVREMGFTHVEFLPLMEHPFFGSWGYQIAGYFAPTARYGSPQDLMYLIDELHQAGIGVILDWVPSHFATDPHGLGFFDGTHLYEHADPRQGLHPDWGSFIFNYGRHEVRSFLLSSALFWLEHYHADGLRVDAVASMLYLDFSRGTDWVPNPQGGRENLDAIAFLKRFNEEVYRRFPDVQTFAEESTAWPGVSRPTYAGGLGFGFKWDMGWMHDTLDYFRLDPIYRKHHHHRLTFRGLYAQSENFVLPLSHDEVVHGKGSLLGKMPGDPWQKFANLRLLLGYMYAVPGKKLLFMGGELAQEREWNHEEELDWWHLDQPQHQGVRLWVKDLNRVYQGIKALHELDCEPAGFQWIVADDADSGVLAFLRHGQDPEEMVLVVAHFTPVLRHDYRVGVPKPGFWEELLNSDAEEYGGSGQGNLGVVWTEPVPAHAFSSSLRLTLPPLGILFLRPRA